MTKEQSFDYRFAKMWNDLIGKAYQHTEQYRQAQAMMKEADAEIERLRAALTKISDTASDIHVRRCAERALTHETAGDDRG